MMTAAVPDLAAPNGFFGRETERVEIRQLLLEPGCRLLTLLGPGGIGKTRLAVEVTSSLRTSFPDGASLISLQAVSSSDFILPAIAEALQLPDGGDDIASRLLDHLRDKTALLMLDNFEHLLDSATVVGDLLAATPGLTLLVTSRERLNLREEWVYNLLGLAVPKSETESSLEQYGAVQLFIHTARRVDQRFQLTAANRSAVTRICGLVEGMPLGIELASIWVRALPCQAIADELQQSLDILETPAHNVPLRHRTMRAAFEPTWRRLSEAERSVFMQLSIFRGGFTHEAAEQVAGATRHTLSALIDRSLLRLGDQGRYDIHELLRQYGEELLRCSPELHEQALDRHRAYYMRFLAECEQEIVFLGQHKHAILQLNADMENVRSAWRRAVVQGQADEITRAAEGLWSFF